jgi:hypothetical protein
MEQVYFLISYRRRITIKQNGRKRILKSRKVEVDCFVSDGDRFKDLSKAFERAEDNPLFRQGWAVTVLPIDYESFQAFYESTLALS